MTAAGTVWTMGHSNRDLAELLRILEEASIGLVADVRRYPGSRRQPHFAQQSLAATLKQSGIDYRHFESLGGRRTSRLPDSPNTAWQNESFAAYADYMLSVDFRAGLDELIHLASLQRTALLCAEAVPWRCHRQLIADALVAGGWTVQHLLAAAKMQPHRLTAFAQVDRGQVTYPGRSLF